MLLIKCPKETSVDKPSKKLISTVNSITQKLFEGTWIDKAGNFKKLYNTSFTNNQGMDFLLKSNLFRLFLTKRIRILRVSRRSY